MTATDYYKVLNVTRQSSLDEIQRAYRKFALKVTINHIYKIGAHYGCLVVSPNETTRRCQR